MRTAIEYALRSAWPPPPPIPVAPWLVESFWDSRIAIARREEEDATPTREQALADLGRTLVEAVVEFVSENGYPALLALEERLAELHRGLLEEVENEDIALVKLNELRSLSRRRDDWPADAVIIAEDDLYVEERGKGKLVEPIDSIVWGMWGKHDDEDFNPSPGATLVIGTRTENAREWVPSSSRLEAYYSEYTPLPLNEWVRRQLRQIDVGSGPDDDDDFSEALDDVEARVKEHRERLDKRADVVELRLAIASAVETHIERYGTSPRDVVGLSSAQGGVELIETGEGRAERRHVSHLRHNRLYVAVKAVELIHQRRVRSWVEAYERLEAELKAHDPHACLPYSEARYLSDTLSRKYKVTIDKAEHSGKRAFAKDHRDEYERLR